MSEPEPPNPPSASSAPPIALDRISVLSSVWPIVLANASAPLLGMADTAIIGRYGTVAALGAIAVGALVFSFVFWGFGFLRMATTGFVAQAHGAEDEVALRLAVLRPLGLGVALGIGLWLLQTPIELGSLAMLDATAAVEAEAVDYIRARIWGAPAALATFALLGTLIGLGRFRHLLVVQVLVNGLNIALNFLFAGALDMGAAGVGLGTAISEWVGLLVAGGIVYRLMRPTDGKPWLPKGTAILDGAQLRSMFTAQLDIMARTLLLLGGFAWFTNEGARFGDATLAANHVLLQLVSFSAFVLDGFAFATEALVGRARGARDLVTFDLALARTTELAAVSAVILAVIIAFTGESIVAMLTDLEPVRAVAGDHVSAAAIYVAVSVAAFQLDGVFIGVTRTRDMRNAAFWSLLLFLGASWALVPSMENHGLWLAFIGYVVVRALTLGAKLPALRRDVAAGF